MVKFFVLGVTERISIMDCYLAIYVQNYFRGLGREPSFHWSANCEWLI